MEREANGRDGNFRARVSARERAMDDGGGVACEKIARAPWSRDDVVRAGCFILASVAVARDATRDGRKCDDDGKNARATDARVSR